MTVIQRYIAGSFLKYFLTVLVLVVFIYLSVDFFGLIDNFMKDGMPYSIVLLYFLYKIPLIVSQITPVGVLLAVLIVFGLMSRNNEVVALKAGGVSVFHIIRPVWQIGVVFTMLLFIFAEIMVPISISKAKRIKSGDVDGSRAVATSEKNLWIKDGRDIVHVKYYHPADQVIYGISIYFFEDDFSLVRRLDARRAMYTDGRWRLEDCMEQIFPRDRRESGTGMETPKTGDSRQHSSKTLSLGITPADFKQVARESEEMGFPELLDYIKKAESEGYDATKYRVDLYAKTAFPLVCLIMCLMGTAIALRSNTGDGMAVSFAYGIVIAFVYWSLYSFCLSLGYGNVLPTWLAAWSANIIFACITGAMLLNLE